MYEKTLRDILKEGQEHFGLLIAIVSKVDGDTYEVIDALSPEDALTPGQTFNLQSTYCIHTLNASEPTAYHHVANSSIKAHPCYRDFGLESYIGCPIIIDDKIFGTLNFSSPMPHTEFTQDDLAYIQELSKEVAPLLK